MRQIKSVFGSLIISFFFTFGLLAPSVMANENSQELKNEIRSVISDQIQAFAAKDVDRAFYHASASIKKMFKNSLTFGSMVKNSYPMIWAPKSYQFLQTSVNFNSAVQRMMFTDSLGQIHFFDYAMERAEKRWVISGVYLVSGGSGV
tara:strand:- start:1 stop:441 length:441 start_codon:yes stop_codon:yes gene_type:complete